MYILYIAMILEANASFFNDIVTWDKAYCSINVLDKPARVVLPIILENWKSWISANSCSSSGMAMFPYCLCHGNYQSQAMCRWFAVIWKPAFIYSTYTTDIQYNSYMCIYTYAYMQWSTCMPYVQQYDLQNIITHVRKLSKLH